MPDVNAAPGKPPRDADYEVLEQRWGEVRANEYAPESISLPAALSELWTDGTLIAAAGQVASGWVDLRFMDSLRIGRSSTGGTYALEIDWSRDGVTGDITEAVAITNNATGEMAVAARYARFRVRNTDGVTAFSAHRTNIFGR